MTVDIIPENLSRLYAADPALNIPGMPPNFGQSLVPHVLTNQGIISSISRVYRPSDEAIKHSFDNARFMKNDPIVMECVEARQRSLALLNWHLESDDEKDEQKKWLCRELTTVIEQTPRFMQYRECLSHAIWYGRAGISQRYNWRPVSGKMRCTVDHWLPVNGDKLVFRYDDGTHEYDPNQIGIRVGAGINVGKGIAQHWTEERHRKVQPTDYGLAYFLDRWEKPLLAVHKHMIEDGEYEDPASAGKVHGTGVRSRIYWCWYQKQESLAFLMEYLERCAAGIDIWYYPLGNAEGEKAVRTAAQERLSLGRNCIMVPRPPGEEGNLYDYQRIEPSMAGAETLKGIIIEYFGHTMKRYILGQTLTSEAQSTGLGSSLADVHLDTFMQIVRYDATNLEESITTELVDHLKRVNFPRLNSIPVRFKIDTAGEDAEAKLKAWRDAFEMGLSIKAQDLRDLIGAAKPDDEDEQLSRQQQEQAAQQQQGGPGGGLSPMPGQTVPGQFSGDQGQLADAARLGAALLPEQYERRGFPAPKQIATRLALREIGRLHRPRSPLERKAAIRHVAGVVARTIGNGLTPGVAAAHWIDPVAWESWTDAAA